MTNWWKRISAPRCRHGRKEDCPECAEDERVRIETENSRREQEKHQEEEAERNRAADLAAQEESHRRYMAKVALRKEAQEREEALRRVEQARIAEERRKEEVHRVEEQQKELARIRKQEAEKIHTLEYLQSLHPIKFEELVLLAFRNLGWDAQGTKASGDRGIDGWLKKDGNTFILQCKRFGKGKVGAPALRDLLGTVVRENATGGFLVTTSSFTADALKWAKGESRLKLYNGEATVSFIRDAFPDGTLVPEDFVNHTFVCPWCGKKTRQVKGKGRRKSFTGCTDYPNCGWTSYKSDEHPQSPYSKSV